MDSDDRLVRMKLAIVSGPTASGKTSLGIELARRFNGAVISADSRMVYRRLDIGTGKPTWEYRTIDSSPWIAPKISSRPSLRKRGVAEFPSLQRGSKGDLVDFGPVYSIDGVDHYGIDLVEPESRFTLTDWLAFARPLIADLQSKHVRPIIVGGTGLYLRALINGFVPAPIDDDTRAKYEALPIDELRRQLELVDPITAKREAGNVRRLARALEVYELTGQPISAVHNSDPIDAIVIAPEIPRAELYRRIDQRLHERFEAGLINEVHTLIDSGISTDWLKNLGLEYRFLTEWLIRPTHSDLASQNEDVGDLEERLATAIHQYARRQLTYLRHQLPVRWVRDIDEAGLVVSLRA